MKVAAASRQAAGTYSSLSTSSLNHAGGNVNFTHFSLPKSFGYVYFRGYEIFTMGASYKEALTMSLSPLPRVSFCLLTCLQDIQNGTLEVSARDFFAPFPRFLNSVCLCT